MVLITVDSHRPGRLAIFLPSLEGGGAEQVTVTLANAFAASGCKVDLVLGVATGPYLSRVARGIRVVDLQAPRVFDAMMPLARYLSRERPDSLLSVMSHANVVAILSRCISRVPVRLVISEHSTVSINAARAGSARERILYRLVAMLYRRADAVVAVSRDAALDLAEFVGLGSGNVHTIYNPFDLARIAEMAREAPGHPWFEAGQPPVLVAVGRLTPEKDFSTLIRAFSRLRKRRDVRLLILGEGALRGDLEALGRDSGLTENDLQMPGFVGNPYKFLARSRAFVLSSQWEGLPSALIEALACGTPVISTDCRSGPREILEDGRWGKLVPVGDAAALSNAMETVLLSTASEVPDGRARAADFASGKIVSDYLEVMRLPFYRGTDAGQFRGLS